MKERLKRTVFEMALQPRKIKKKWECQYCKKLHKYEVNAYWCCGKKKPIKSRLSESEQK